MSILDGVLGGLVSAGATAIVKHVLEQNGGVQGLVDRFEQTGMGSIVQSWVGTGQNAAISADQIQQALGSDKVRALADKFGIPVDQIAAKLAEHLPATVDKMTPDGVIPEAVAA